MNKYEKVPEYIVDLHGHTIRETQEILENIIKDGKYNHIRVITGKGQFRDSGPRLRTFVQGYLNERNILWNVSKISHGGEGSLEVFLSEQISSM